MNLDELLTQRQNLITMLDNREISINEFRTEISFIDSEISTIVEKYKNKSL